MIRFSLFLIAAAVAVAPGCLLDRSGVDVGGDNADAAPIPDADPNAPDADPDEPDAQDLGPITHASNDSASAGMQGLVLTKSVDVVQGRYYLLAVSHRPQLGQPLPSITDVLGPGGQDWTLVSSQCASNDDAPLDVYSLRSDQTTSGLLTVTFTTSFETAVFALTGYDNVSASDPIGAKIGLNTSGGGCDVAADPQTSYSGGIVTERSDGLVYAAVSTEARNHTPGPGFTERADVQIGSGGNTSGVAVSDRQLDGRTSLDIQGSFNGGGTDWALVALELRR
jgi:hypothetical protein